MSEEFSVEQKRVLKENPEYFQPKIVGGVLCALRNYATTTAIVVNISEYSIERRYCYQNPADAVLALLDFEDVTKHPSRNWIKVKGSMNFRHIDEFNPKWLNDDGVNVDHNKPPRRT